MRSTDPLHCPEPLTWDSSAFEYAGWVPTASGHLSFSLIGDPRTRPNCASGHVLEKAPNSVGHRSLLVVQKRTARDLPLWPFLAEQLIPESTAYYIFVGRTGSAQLSLASDFGSPTLSEDEVGRLSGTAYIIPKSTNKIWKRRIKSILHKLNDLITEVNVGKVDEQREFHKRFDDIIDDAKRAGLMA